MRAAVDRGARNAAALWRRQVVAVPVVAELGPELLCHAYGPGDADAVHDAVAAYRLAEAKAQQVRAALVSAGLAETDFPQLTPSVDARGRPVVVLGPVSATVAARLGEILTGQPGPDGWFAA